MRTLALGSYLFACVVSASIPGCSENGDCTDNVIPAMTVGVRDKTTGALICDGQIHITAPALDETFQCSPDGGSAGLTCCSIGTNGPAGVEYTVEVTASGYAATTRKVFVPADECGQPVTQHVTIEMQPL